MNLRNSILEFPRMSKLDADATIYKPVDGAARDVIVKKNE